MSKETSLAEMAEMWSVPQGIAHLMAEAIVVADESQRIAAFAHWVGVTVGTVNSWLDGVRPDDWQLVSLQARAMEAAVAEALCCFLAELPKSRNEIIRDLMAQLLSLPKEVQEAQLFYVLRVRDTAEVEGVN